MSTYPTDTKHKPGSNNGDGKEDMYNLNDYCEGMRSAADGKTVAEMRGPLEDGNRDDVRVGEEREEPG